MSNHLPAAPETTPAAWYRDPALWPRERERIFAKSWQFVTHESALPEPGSWVAETIAGWPILLVRDEKRGINGFHNVCRHRAGPLIEGESGRCTDGALTCKYHGWRYLFDGRLRLARDFGAAANFDPRAFNLFPLRVELWRGLVFIALSKDVEPLAEWLAPIDKRLPAEHWRDLKVALRRRHDLSCNWKTYAENYLEGYHVPVLHPGLSAEVDSTHYTVEVEGRTIFQWAPTLRPGTVYNGAFAFVWPNTGVNLYNTGLMMERIAPIGFERTHLEYLYLMPGCTAPSDATMTLSDSVTAEDKFIVERIQENLNAGIYDTGFLSPKHEAAVAAFQNFVRAALA